MTDTTSPDANGTREQRLHPLREEWVVDTVHRQNRPWSGEITEGGADSAPEERAAELKVQPEVHYTQEFKS